MAAMITDKHYGDIKALANDLARALNVELKDKVTRGAEMVQFAEVLTFFDPADWVIEAISIAWARIASHQVRGSSGAQLLNPRRWGRSSRRDHGLHPPSSPG